MAQPSLVKWCVTCQTRPSREWVPKREERCSDRIVRSIDHGNIGRAITANITAALVKIVDQALTILSNRTSNLDTKAKIGKANILPALIDTCLSGTHGAVVTLMDPSKNVTERGKRKAMSTLELLHKAS
ncbi:LOW QUALITY PROTEIN: hypothetical protein HID58_060162, partial [Brassica napus]